MESWMISSALAICGVIASYAATRQIVSSQGREIEKLKSANKNLHQNYLSDLKTFKDESKPLLIHLSKSEDSLKDKSEKQSEDIVFLKEKVSNAATMKDVRSEFVSKELFLSLERHIDGRFVRLERSMDRGFDNVLKKLEDLK